MHVTSFMEGRLTHLTPQMPYMMPPVDKQNRLELDRVKSVKSPSLGSIG